MRQETKAIVLGFVLLIVFFAGMATDYYVLPIHPNVRTVTTTVATYTKVTTITLPIVAPYYTHPIFHVIDGLTNKSIPNAYLSLQGEQGQYIETMRTNQTGYAEPTNAYLVSTFQGHSIINIAKEDYVSVWVPVPASNKVITLRMYPIGCFVGASGCHS